MFKRVRFVLLIILLLATKAGAQYYSIPDSYGKYPFDFRDLEDLSALMNPNDTLKPRYENGRGQYINTRTGEILNRKQFEAAYPFYQQYAVVKDSGKYGIINKKGDFVVPPRFSGFYLDDYPFGIVFSSEMFFDLQTGKLDTFRYGEIDPYLGMNYSYTEGGKYSIVIKGRKKTRAIYDSILFADRRFVVVKKGGKYGFIDTSGAVLIPIRYVDIILSRPDYFALKKGSEWYYYRGLTLLFHHPFQPIALISNKFIFEVKGFYNYFDNAGQTVLPVNYKWISFKSRLAINAKDQLVFLNDKYEEFVFYNCVAGR
jgi:hypothetical protein